MNRGRQVPGFDSDSLQADVMRFMAIIGFCLVAVFALVRNSDSATSPVPAPQSIDQRALVAAAPPSAEETVAPTSPAPIEPRLAPPATPPPPQMAPRPAPPVEATPPAPPIAPRAEIRVATISPETPEPAESSAPPPASPEPGLSLSFASNRDFMRLLGAGTIELFVMPTARDQSTLRFDPQRNFVSTEAPGQIYELLPETIPPVILGALSDARPATVQPDSATWGVRLPATLERAIAQHRRQHQSGTLLIDRDARIRHVPAA